MDKYKELVEFVKTLEGDFYKFYEKNNKVAGIRIRKKMQILRSMAKDIRVEVRETTLNERNKK